MNIWFVTPNLGFYVKLEEHSNLSAVALACSPMKPGSPHHCPSTIRLPTAWNWVKARWRRTHSPLGYSLYYTTLAVSVAPPNGWGRKSLATRLSIDSQFPRGMLFLSLEAITLQLSGELKTLTIAFVFRNNCKQQYKQVTIKSKHYVDSTTTCHTAVRRLHLASGVGRSSLCNAPCHPRAIVLSGVKKTLTISAMWTLGLSRN